MVQAGRLQRREGRDAELHAVARRVLRPRAARRARELARAGRRARGKPLAGLRRGVREADAARPHGARRRLQRRDRVPRLARVGLHDGRHARRRRRLDGAMRTTYNAELAELAEFLMEKILLRVLRLLR